MLDLSFELTNNQPLPLSQFKGKVVMIVNIATQCGFTDQLHGMEELQKKYQGQDFVLIGVPSNDFKNQTPENDAEVASFCQLNYQTSFLVTKKVKIKGTEQEVHPFFNYLKKQRKGSNVKWNFEKFIFNRNGEYVDYFSTLRAPNSPKITGLIDSLLKS